MSRRFPAGELYVDPRDKLLVRRLTFTTGPREGDRLVAVYLNADEAAEAVRAGNEIWQYDELRES